MSIVDAAWRQTERPDADHEPGDVAEAIACQHCGDLTPLDDLHQTRRGLVVCLPCWLRLYELPPLPEVEA